MGDQGSVVVPVQLFHGTILLLSIMAIEAFAFLEEVLHKLCLLLAVKVCRAEAIHLQDLVPTDACHNPETACFKI